MSKHPAGFRFLQLMQQMQVTPNDMQGGARNRVENNWKQEYKGN
jgi:hypothetical protein